MTFYTRTPFTREEALALWSRLVAGWADHLDATGSRTLIDGIPNYADAGGGSYETTTRMLWGLGSWLSYPNRPSVLTWQGKAYNVEELTYRALVNGCDPNSVNSWRSAPLRGDRDQRTVESGQVSFALWQTRDRIWARLSEKERNDVVGWLDYVGQHPDYWFNNWALFWAVNHAGRKALGAPFDQSIIDEVIGEYVDGVYVGDGWYDDDRVKGVNYFDNYITWVFGSHVMAWAQIDGDSKPERRDELLERVRLWMNHFPYFFAVDGATVEYGRSLAYKFCRLGAPLWAYKLGLWDHSVGMLKRLVGRHIRWYVDRGAVRADGTLRQELTASGSPEVIERYISTGATYWAIQAFGGLWSLPDDDPFWTVEEEPLPAEQSDFVKVFQIPGWVLTARDGQVHQYNAGAVHPGYGNKYTKLVYSSRFPFNVGLDAGQPSLDGTICLSENGIRGQRETVISSEVGESGWLKSHYAIEVNGHKHLLDTVMIPLGDVHLRAHRITLDPAAGEVIAEEGCSPLVYDAGAIPSIWTEGGWLFAKYVDDAVGILPLHGYISPAKITPGSPNSVFAMNLLPVLATPLNVQHELICLCYAGGVPNLANLPTIEGASWTLDGQFEVTINGEALMI